MPTRSVRPVLIIGLLTGTACLGTLGCHWLLRPLVQVELEDIWPCIMANNIQIEFSPDDLSAINLGDQNSFAFHIRSHEEITKRINDAAPAAIHN